MTRVYSYVQWSEIEPLLNLIKNKTKCSTAEVAETLGWSDSMFQAGAREGKIRKGVRFALLGLASELHADGGGKLPTARQQFSTDELSELFQAVLTERKRSPGNTNLPGLLSKLSQELSR